MDSGVPELKFYPIKSLFLSCYGTDCNFKTQEGLICSLKYAKMDFIIQALLPIITKSQKKKQNIRSASICSRKQKTVYLFDY